MFVICFFICYVSDMVWRNYCYLFIGEKWEVFIRFRLLVEKVGMVLDVCLDFNGLLWW